MFQVDFYKNPHDDENNDIIDIDVPDIIVEDIDDFKEINE